LVLETRMEVYSFLIKYMHCTFYKKGMVFYIITMTTKVPFSVMQ
jgi:hypothetical protein